MARVNIGINPIYLADQHLIAESVEITMIAGSLRINEYTIKGRIPETFSLGAGHINFFKNKLSYLARRLDIVNEEMIKRNFNPGTTTECLKIAPLEFQNDWQPAIGESVVVRNRITEKILKKPVGFWRYRGNPIANINDFAEKLLQSELFNV